MQSGIGEDLVEEVFQRLLRELSSAITSGISGFLAQLKTQIVNYLDGFFKSLIDPMVGTPAPEGPNARRAASRRRFRAGPIFRAW